MSISVSPEYRGAAELVTRFLDWYSEFAGDPAPTALRHHYIAYRALVRAKVACLRSQQSRDQDSVPPSAQAGTEARHYGDIALRHLRAGEVRLVLVGGAPGTGKSTVSDAVAGRLGMVLLASDRVRKELHGLAPHQSGQAPYQAGIYAPEATERTYAELLTRAANCLAQGESVLLDASWTRAAHRRAAAETARRAHATFVELRCTAPAEVTAARLRERTAAVSDADEAIGRTLNADADPWPQANPVFTGGSVDAAVHEALTALSGTDRDPAGE